MTENNEPNNPLRCKQCDKLYKTALCQSLWVTVTHTGDWRTDEYLCWECQWSPEFPTEPGIYWFYGWAFIQEEEKPNVPSEHSQPIFYLVEVMTPISGRLYYITNGSAIYPRTSLGVWRKAELPVAPPIKWDKIVDRGENDAE